MILESALKKSEAERGWERMTRTKVTVLVPMVEDMGLTLGVH